MKNTFAPRVASQSHTQEEALWITFPQSHALEEEDSIAFSLELRTQGLNFFSCQRERELSSFFAFIGFSGHIHNLKTT